MPLERKADSSLKDITSYCWVELGCDSGGKEKLNTFCQNKHGTRISQCGLQQSVIGKETAKVLSSQITGNKRKCSEL